MVVSENKELSQVFEQVFIDGSGLLRYATASENLPAGTITYWEKRGNVAYTQVQNDAGRYYYRPSITAPAARRVVAPDGTPGWTSSTTQPIKVLSSTHFSPHTHYKPVIQADANGLISGQYCMYTGGQLFPYEKSDSQYPALHSIQHKGFMVDFEVTPDGDRLTNTASSPSACRSRQESTKMMASAWFLILVDGSVTFSTKPLRYLVNCMTTNGVVEENQCSQAADVIPMLRSGNSCFYLIKSSSFELNQDNPLMPTGWDVDHITQLESVWQPGLALTLDSSTTVSVTGWGTTLWVMEYGGNT